MLSSKIRVTVQPEKMVRLSEKYVRFYTKYASIAFKSLKKPKFQKFVRWMLRREKMEAHIVETVQVRVFPFQKKNGNSLAGRCHVRTGEIRIYPKKLESCRKLVQKFGKEKAHSYIKNRAKASLIHEILHLKYSSDEERVRELTRKYLTLFFKHRNTQNSDAHNILKMLFKK